MVIPFLLSNYTTILICYTYYTVSCTYRDGLWKLKEKKINTYIHDNKSVTMFWNILQPPPQQPPLLHHLPLLLFRPLYTLIWMNYNICYLYCSYGWITYAVIPYTPKKVVYIFKFLKKSILRLNFRSLCNKSTLSIESYWD